MSIPFWQSDPDAHWSTLLGVLETYCHPEIATGDGYERLQRLAKREDDEEMRVFKEELREAILDPAQIPGDSLAWAVQYDDGSDEAFLTRVWRDLYPEEPLPTA